MHELVITIEYNNTHGERIKIIKIAVYQHMMVRKSGCYEFTNLQEEPAAAPIFNREDGGGNSPPKNVGKFAPKHMRSCPKGTGFVPKLFACTW